MIHVMALLVVVLLASPAAAVTYYVDQAHSNASDTNPGTSEAAPWRTLHRAVTGVPAYEGGISGTFQAARAGDTVLVKPGRYCDVTSSPNAERDLKYNPANSGTPGNPIVFRAFNPAQPPRVCRTWGGVEGFNYPVIGTMGRSHIVWDGFALEPRSNVVVWSSSNVLVDRLTIAPGGGAYLDGNYDGIRIEESTDVEVRNSVIRDVFYHGNTHHNAACIKIYDSLRIWVHHNEMVNCNAGVYDKEAGVNNRYEYNLFRAIRADAVLFTTYSTPRCSSWGCRSGDNVVRHNIVIGPSYTGVNLKLGGNGPFTIEHNVFYQVAVGIQAGGATAGVRIRNNIVSILPMGGDAFLYDFWAGIPGDLQADYNDLLGTSALRVNWDTYSYAAWTASGRDRAALTLDPRFVGPLTAAAGFRPTEPAVLQGGRVGGVASGAVVPMGAYVTGTEVIGVSTGGGDSTMPAAPTGLRISATGGGGPTSGAGGEGWARHAERPRDRGVEVM